MDVQKYVFRQLVKRQNSTKSGLKLLSNEKTWPRCKVKLHTSISDNFFRPESIHISVTAAVLGMGGCD